MSLDDPENQISWRVRWLELCLQVSQDAFVLLDLRRVAGRFLAERCRFGFLFVLARPAFAFSDLLVQAGQLVLGFVELLDDLVVLGDQLAVLAGLPQVHAGLVGSLADRGDLVATDEERRHGFFVLGRRHRERLLGVVDLLGQLLGLAFERHDCVHVGSHLPPAGQQLGGVAEVLERHFVVGQNGRDRIGVGFFTVAIAGDQSPVVGPLGNPALAFRGQGGNFSGVLDEPRIFPQRSTARLTASTGTGR